MPYEMIENDEDDDWDAVNNDVDLLKFDAL